MRDTEEFLMIRSDFDDSCLNEVEKYNIQLISTYEQQAGGN